MKTHLEDLDSNFRQLIFDDIYTLHEAKNSEQYLINCNNHTYFVCTKDGNNFTQLLSKPDFNYWNKINTIEWSKYYE
jgi:hypothetical protein